MKNLGQGGTLSGSPMEEVSFPKGQGYTQPAFHLFQRVRKSKKEGSAGLHSLEPVSATREKRGLRKDSAFIQAVLCPSQASDL